MGKTQRDARFHELCAKGFLHESQITVGYGEVPFDILCGTVARDGYFAMYLSPSDEEAANDYRIVYGLYDENDNWIDEKIINNADNSPYFAAFPITRPGTYRIRAGFKKKNSEPLSGKKHNFTIYTEIFECTDIDGIAPHYGIEEFKLLYSVISSSSVGGGVSEWLAENNVNRVTLVGCNLLLKMIATEIFYKDKVALGSLFSFDFIPQDDFSSITKVPTSRGLIYDIHDLAGVLKGDVLICRGHASEEMRNELALMNPDIRIFTLDEILKDEFAKALLFRPLIEFSKKHNIPVVFVRTPTAAYLADYYKDKLLESDVDISKVAIKHIRQALKKDPPQMLPALECKGYSLQEVMQIAAAYTYTRRNGICTLNDRKSDLVNIENGQRRTTDQPPNIRALFIRSVIQEHSESVPATI